MPDEPEAMNVFSIAIAALLHDIGKFAQRAGCQELYKKDMEGQILPVDELSSRYSHQHAIYTYGFMENYLQDHLPKGVAKYQELAQLAARHHNVSTAYEHFIKLGDWAASGLDRIKREQQRGDPSSSEMPLVATLSLVKIEDWTPIPSRTLGLTSLDEPIQEANKLSLQQYRALWDRFIEDLQRLPEIADPYAYLITLDSLLERWTSLIPSATYKSEPDVSLYDHDRMATAFAACAYVYHATKKDLAENFIENTNDKKWLFVYGDVQGIQKHIYNLKKNDKASKLLRARSFQIEALCKSAVQNLIKRCGVVPQCEITNGGGNFMVLLPNTEQVRQAVRAYEQAINSFLLREYIGTLSLNLTFGPEVALNDLQQDRTSALLQQIHAANYQGKQKRFQSVLESNGHYVDYYYEKARKVLNEGGALCPLCDYRPAEIAQPDAEPICQHCDALISLGTRLPKVHAMVLTPFDPTKQNVPQQSASFGFFPVVGQLEGGGIAYCINGYGQAKEFKAFHPAPYHVPTMQDRDGELRVCTFEEIADNKTGANKLAMFKADVDNLGHIFAKGLGNNVSLSKYASLSRQLHYFFSVNLNNWIKEHYADTIYTVYSGGDDICVLGRWNVIFDFAKDIHDQFTKFVFDNPSVTLSAGIALADSTMPIPLLAEEAERQLKKAKAESQKNSISVFSVPVSWQEFNRLLTIGKQYAEYLGQGKLPVSLFRKLLDLSNRAWGMLVEGDIQPRNTLWLSQLKYTIARYHEMRSCNVPNQFWDQLLVNLTSNNYQMMWKSKISVCYALYSIRKEENHGNLLSS